MRAGFGIEEEFVFLDPRTLRTVDLGPHAVDALAAGPADGVTREFFPSQVEYASPVCHDAQEARASLLDFRSRLGELALRRGVLAAAVGTPPQVRSGPDAPRSGRYARIAHAIEGLAHDHQINGLHVHVGIDDPDARIRASNHLRPWLPVLLALSANSPFWAGSDSGFASWRAIHSRRWTTYGIPPWFEDADDYAAAVTALAGVGATSDPGTINWTTRLSATHPTLEVRVCDVPLDADTSVALALITRALATRGASEATPRPSTFEPWDAALWHAARDGMRGSLVHPLSGRLASAPEVIGALRDQIRGVVIDEDRAFVDDVLDRILVEGTGSDAQRRALADGVPALAQLYRTSLDSGRPRTVEHVRV